ncbi:MAG: hypothetical protein J2P59_06240, partial [Acidimicrobiales bacterium]|nr:hypothetical protein [Acidimicrobiales bacterium]
GRALIGESGAGGEEPENPVPAENPAPAENPVLAGSPVPPDSPAIRAGLVPGPYVAETVPVSVEEEYVVIDA